MLIPSEREQLDAMTDFELVAYWNILQTPGIKADDGKTERHKPIVDALLTERKIPHEKGKRTMLDIQKPFDRSLDHLIYDEQNPRPASEPEPCSCGGEFQFAIGCGVQVCTTCDKHKGLDRCFCGWAASGGNGYAELEEMGEQIEPD